MLTQSQKKQLKALANNMDALYQIGKKELGEQQLIMLDKALEARELIKSPFKNSRDAFNRTCH